MADDAGIEVRASRRLSLSATVHVIAYRGHQYIVVESGRGSTTTVSPLVTPGIEQGNTP